jgi:hypothetical protein
VPNLGVFQESVQIRAGYQTVFTDSTVRPAVEATSGGSPDEVRDVRRT